MQKRAFNMKSTPAVSSYLDLNLSNVQGQSIKHFPTLITDSFPKNRHILCNCWLTGYFVINIHKCYLLFDILCICNKFKINIMLFIGPHHTCMDLCYFRTSFTPTKNGTIISGHIIKVKVYYTSQKAYH